MLDLKSARIFWFTGLAGAGKSTVCVGVSERLKSLGWDTMVLDGDDVRARLHRHLGFSPEDIDTNNNLIVDLCIDNRKEKDAILVPIIPPFRDSRRRARQCLGEGFHEVFCDANLDVVVARDLKGLYAKAFRNEITNMIGVASDVPYEPPETPDLVLHTGDDPPEVSIATFADFADARISQAVYAST